MEIRIIILIIIIQDKVHFETILKMVTLNMTMALFQCDHPVHDNTVIILMKTALTLCSQYIIYRFVVFTYVALH